jgi:hypothetical protein
MGVIMRLQPFAKPNCYAIIYTGVGGGYGRANHRGYEVRILNRPLFII